MARDRPETSYAWSGDFSIADQVSMTVHVAARISALAGPGEVLVPRTVRDFVLGSGPALSEARTHKLKGVPDTWELFTLAKGR